VVKHKLYHDGLKPRFREGTSDPRVAILKPQIDIIKASMMAFIFESNNTESTTQG